MKLNRNAVWQVERNIRQSGINVDTTFSPRGASIRPIMNQLAGEGVAAAIIITDPFERSGRLNLHIFRAGGITNGELLGEL